MDFLLSPGPLWPFASVSACLSWCILHCNLCLHGLSSLPLSPRLAVPFRDLRAHLPCVLGESLVSSGSFGRSLLPSQAPAPPCCPLQLQEKSEGSRRAPVSESRVSPGTSRGWGVETNGLAWLLPGTASSQLLHARSNFPPPPGSLPGSPHDAQRVSSDYRSYLHIFSILFILPPPAV